MLWVPSKGIMRVEHNVGTVGAAPVGTNVVTGGASNTKGAVSELITSTAFDSYWMTILANNYAVAATLSEACLDILVGASTEEVFIANLLAGYCGGGTNADCGPKRWDFPVYIPAGTRIAAQAAGSRLTSNIRVAIFLYGGISPGYPVGTKVTTYGVTVPDGTALTPGASAAEGAFAQITASTSQNHIALVPSFQTSADTTINNRIYMVDIGVGSATEEEIAQSYIFRVDLNEMIEGPWNSMPAFVDVPSGTRLAMRASNNGTNDGAYTGAIHAVS